MCDTDVFVCGGGPAGLSAAIAARLAGLRVTLADPAHPPIDKACGEGIMPAGLRALEAMGVALRESEGVPFAGIHFSDAAGAVEARFPEGAGLGVRRTRMHAALARRAAELGITMHWGVRVDGLASGGVSLNGRMVRARFLVGADGQQSRLRDGPGFLATGPTQRRFGFRRHYRVAPWSEWVEVYWSDVGQMYVTPVAEDEICLAFLTRRSDIRFADALPMFPELSARLADVAFTPSRGAVTVTRRFRHVQRGHVALIGDASGSVDAITGDGLSLAFRQALALADAMQEDHLAAYEKAHRRIVRLPRAMAKLLLAMDKHPHFRRRAIRALSREPSVFARLLAMHAGGLSPQEFGMRQTLALGWRVLTA